MVTTQVRSHLCLTEDDYLGFSRSIFARTSKSKTERAGPRVIEEALTATSLLFVGYRLSDINFRVIFRGLVAP